VAILPGVNSEREDIMTCIQSVLRVVWTVSLVACGSVDASQHSRSGESASAGSAAIATVDRVIFKKTSAPSTHDWTQFGWDAARSSSSLDPTGITARNVGGLARQQVQLDGTVDASAIYLHAASVKGASHDVFFVTTT
jgi:hypothetical protein